MTCIVTPPMFNEVDSIRPQNIGEEHSQAVSLFKIVSNSFNVFLM